MDDAAHPIDEAAFAPSFLGILYAEDFDALPSPAPEAAPEPVVSFTQDELDQACIAAVASAQQAWEASAARQRVDLLAQLGAALAEARGQAERAVLDVTGQMVTVMLAMLAGALPRLCSEHGPAEVRALVTRLLPSLSAEAHVQVRVHADLVAELRRTLADAELDAPAKVSVVAANLPRGDVRVSWEGGSLSRDTRQIHQAIGDVLGELGLQQIIETSPKRSFAHAE